MFEELISALIINKLAPVISDTSEFLINFNNRNCREPTEQEVQFYIEQLKEKYPFLDIEKVKPE